MTRDKHGGDREDYTDGEWLAQRFEAHRTRLRAVAYRMLGSISEADDAVQEAWLRLSRSDAGRIADLEGWLITVVARVCLDELRSRRSRRDERLAGRVPEPMVSRDGEIDPEQAALLGDAVGLVLFVVLDTLAPAERLAFVLQMSSRCRSMRSRPSWTGPLPQRGSLPAVLDAVSAARRCPTPT